MRASPLSKESRSSSPSVSWIQIGIGQGDQHGQRRTLLDRPHRQKTCSRSSAKRSIPVKRETHGPGQGGIVGR